MWTKRQRSAHEKAARDLGRIKNNAFRYISTHPHCTERDVQEQIIAAYKECNLNTALGKPIVAFGPSAANPHYDPSQGRPRRIRKNTVVMIDVWAKPNKPRMPFADITWMGFYGPSAGGVPKEIQKAFATVITARNACIALLRSKLRNRELPTGQEVDAAAMQILLDAGYRYRKEILHTTGHSIGTTSPHGRYGAISSKNKQSLKKNLGYTIEPGVYLKGKYGIRSEIDFYVTSDFKLQITTKQQQSFVAL